MSTCRSVFISDLVDKSQRSAEAKMYVCCSSHLLMMVIVIHSFHTYSLKPIKALLLNSASFLLLNLLHIFYTGSFKVGFFFRYMKSNRFNS